MCGGPSSTELELQQEQADFYKTQVQAYNNAYKNFSDLQDTLNKQFAPVLAKGPGQAGYTDFERNTLQTQAREGTASRFNQAEEAANAAINARGGGNDTTNIGSGEAGQLHGALAATAASSEAGEELGITENDFDLGRSRYDQAVAGEENLAAGWNPNAFSSSATGSGKLASDTAHQITQEQNSVWGNVLGALSGVAGSWAGAGFGIGGKKNP